MEGRRDRESSLVRDLFLPLGFLPPSAPTSLLLLPDLCLRGVSPISRLSWLGFLLCWPGSWSGDGEEELDFTLLCSLVVWLRERLTRS